jgi:oxepin-CoA hydrolase/3-oxo-5,6-dehydrosuberyl-CoA semialdehyde dehydrogenase
MLEKLAPTWLAGMPAIVKPATATSYLTEAMVRAIIESKIVPDGALQLICGGVGDIFDHLTCQDVVTFTGSAATGRKLKQHPVVIENSVRFNMEADSLNCSILGTDVEPGDEEFELFVKEVAREITVKAGQKCTAIRRTIVPENRVEAVMQALSKRLQKITLGDPRREEVRMGPLASLSQVEDVKSSAQQLLALGEKVFGDLENFEVLGADRKKGAFFPTFVVHCNEPFKKTAVHDIEAFGPVTTIMPYKGANEAIELARLGRGSLCGSIITGDEGFARKLVLGTAAYHGRLLVLNRHSAKESTGHGSPMPHLVHGGPGRAGGGEEMGGIRGVLHYMQRTAIQGTPTTLKEVCHVWVRGAEEAKDRVHPFRKHFEELQIGETLLTHRRTVTEADVVNFANLSGDHFYAHVDEIGAQQSIFEKRVAHGYFVLAAAAGLFVDPGVGPVLANYGLENLRFTKPVFIGDTIQVRLTCKQKTPKHGTDQGVVAWDVEVFNQSQETVAVYTILTLVKRLAVGSGE